MTEDPDEQRVRDRLGQHGLTASRFAKCEMECRRTPDFRVFKDNIFQFFSEVKSSRADKWLDVQIRGSVEVEQPPENVGGARKDPRFNRLTGDIHTAVKQFDAVNPNREHPNVLALVNHDRQLGFLDLLAVLTGKFFADDGSTHSIYRKFSEGRIKGDVPRIDLYLWLDDYKPERLLFGQVDPRHHELLCEALELEPKEIKPIPQ
jgi:hypothetical protein